MDIQVSVALDLRCRLGEGLHWDEFRQVLWFVDILAQRLFRFDPRSLTVTERQLPEPVGWAISIQGSPQMVVGLKSGIGLISADEPDSPIRWLERGFPADNDQRLNDAKLDRFGRIWLGSVSMTDESQPVGSLARYTLSTGSLEILEGEYRVPNGPAFNQDSTIMLHSDSGRRSVFRYDLNPDDGQIERRSLWKAFPEEDGFPDGMTFDAEGNVWIAHWGAGKVCRYSSAGERLQTIPLPVTQVTNVCFGGESLSRMFISSARHGLSSHSIASQPLAGSLFEISGVDACGLSSWQGEDNTWTSR